MSGRRIASFATAVLAVLAFAVVAIVARGALQSGPATSRSPKAAAENVTGPDQLGATGPQTFDLADAQADTPSSAALIATSTRRSIRVYRYAKVVRKPRLLRQRVFKGQHIPLVFSVRSQRKGWVRVQLPTRPNLSSAWVRRRDVRFTFTRMHVRVSLRQHRMDVYDGSRLRLRARIGVGKSLTPTPKGRYFVTDVVRPRDPKGFYGPYALGLSAHSNVYTSFEGGNGQVGLHGTNRPGAIGSDVSHGCVRVRNSVITRMARSLPLGTPVTIA